MGDRLRALLASLTRHPGTKALSLVLAVAAWLWVQSQEVAEATLRVTLVYRLPDHLVNVSPLPTSAALQVRGPRAAVRRAQRDRPQLRVDLSGEGAGPLDVHLDAYELEGVPAALERGLFRPDTLAIRLDERVERNVAVGAVWVGEPARGHAIQAIAVVPDVVRLSGPRAVLDGVESVSTQPIDVSGWDASHELPARLDLPRGVRTAIPWSGMASIEVVSLLSTRTVPKVPVRLWNHDTLFVTEEGSREVTITLRGPTRALRDLRTDRLVAWVELPDPAPDAVRVEARFEAATPPRWTLSVPLSADLELVGEVPTLAVVPP